MNEKLPQKVLQQCDGSYEKAVVAVLGLSRALWSGAFPAEGEALLKYDEGMFRLRDESAFLATLNEERTAALAPLLLEALALKGGACYSLEVFQPVTLARRVLGELKSEHDLRYFVMRSIRHHYGCILSHETAYVFHLLANKLSALLDASIAAAEAEGGKRIWNYRDELLKPLEVLLTRDQRVREKPGDAVAMFIECCRAVNFLRPAAQTGQIEMLTRAIDGEYLLAGLFGLSTGIRGFDDLFGGGGIMLTEEVRVSKDAAIPSSSPLPGRTVLITGLFGSGKTLLALQLAVEVARKGGLAWMMPLEQSASECLYALEAMCALPGDESVRVATNTVEALEVLDRQNDERGALIILNDARSSDFDSFLEAFQEHAEEMREYPLRLIIADPINSVNHETSESAAQLRRRIVEAIDVVRQGGTNVLLVAEEGSDPANNLAFEQNIADTVVRLSIARAYDYAQRYFEISKSRFQRQQRGEHPFGIKPGLGIRIYPSSAAVAQIRPRSLSRDRRPILFGLPALDNILREGSLSSGDVLIFQGLEESHKTPLGLQFLLGSDASDHEQENRTGRPACSLFLTARSDESKIRDLLDQHSGRFQGSGTGKTIRLGCLPRGHVAPGFIFQWIEDAIRDATEQGDAVDRVLFDDIAHLEMRCPFIHEDKQFGDTLVAFLRRQRVTSLLICGDRSEVASSVVQRAIVHNADCLIQFRSYTFRGMDRVMLRVTKTPGMRHRPGSFEIAFEPNGPAVRPSPLLLREGTGGELKPVEVRLFLHSESDMQKQYNETFLSALKPILSPQTTIEEQHRVYMNGAMSLGSSSATDELQVLQLDELQLPQIEEPQVPQTEDLQPSQPRDAGANALTLYPFEASQWNENDRQNFLERLSGRIRTREGSVFAVPFYENVSLLAYHQGKINEEDISSWEKLAGACERWEREHPLEEHWMAEGEVRPRTRPHRSPGNGKHRQQPKKSPVFFEFPRATPENYNSLFFEILAAYGKPDTSGDTAQNGSMQDWLSCPRAVDAGVIYRRLCRRAYFVGKGYVLDRYQDMMTMHPIRVNKDAVVWRHWYSTLNQMMADLYPEVRKHIALRPLPGNVSVAGEWYLGIPAHSAAPDVGLEIVKMLTSPEQENERLLRGVGLPVRKDFYESRPGRDEEVFVSPYFKMRRSDLRELVQNAIRRSDFRCYFLVSKVLAQSLQRIIEIPDGTVDEVRERIERIFEQFVDSASTLLPADYRHPVTR